MKYYAKEYQDMFAHKLIGNKGTYLDLGSHHPYEGNNSAALEELGWDGVSVDFQSRWVNLFNNSQRKNKCLSSDVTTEGFIKLLSRNWDTKHFDYISLDVDEASIPCLQLLISHDYTFDVMTFEHDIYNGEPESKIRKESSVKILKKAGYEILFENVLTDGTEKQDSKGNPIWEPWEDWWVSKKYLSKLDNRKINIKYEDIMKILPE